MKTIQEYLQNCDRESIINDFIYLHAFDAFTLMNKKKRNVTIGEIVDYYTENLNALIDVLTTIEPQKTEDRSIFIAFHRTGTETDEIYYALVKESELDNEYISCYDYAFLPFDISVGFYVADTYLTQYELHNLLVQYLFEVSWTGFEQEHLDEQVRKIEKSCEDAEAHKDDPDYFISTDELIKRMEDKFGFELEKQDPKQIDAWNELTNQMIDYNQTCKQIEIDKLKELLAKEN